MIALITLALGTYSNRVTIYTAPILSGFLAAYTWRFTQRVRWVRSLLLPLLIILGFVSLVFSGSTIYWDYSAGNPITHTSYRLIYSLGYHYNVGSYYTTNWLTYYQVINYVRNVNTTKVFPYPGPLFDYNKDDLLWLANDVNILDYYNALHEMAQSSIVYNDGINAYSITW